jgi:hypothetical protein
MSNFLSSQEQDRALEARVVRGVLKALWSLASSIGLVFFVPLLLLLVIGIFSGSFAIGTPELGLLWLCWLVGIPTVAVLWYRKYVAGR